MTDQRARILASACDLYEEAGLDGFSMRKLARNVGVTAPALYRHYESKEHVLADVVREAYREFSKYLYHGLEGGTPEERLRRGGEGYLDFALEQPRWYKMVYISPEQIGMEELPEDIESMGCAVHQFWVDRLRECMDAGLLKPGEPEEVALTMWAHAHGLITLFHNGHFRLSQAEFRVLYKTSAARILGGIATEPYLAVVQERIAEEAGALQAAGD